MMMDLWRHTKTGNTYRRLWTGWARSLTIHVDIPWLAKVPEKERFAIHTTTGVIFTIDLGKDPGDKEQEIETEGLTLYCGLDGRAWLRPTTEWHELIDTPEGRRPRFYRI